MHRTILLICGLTFVAPGCADRDRWTPVDDSRLFARCTGIVTSLSIPPRGLVVVRVRPQGDNADLMAAGQTEIDCEIEDEHRAPFGPILARLELGQTVTAHGYWVRHTRGDSTSHKLRTTTSLRIER